MPAGKSKKSKSGPKTSNQTFDRREAKAKTSTRQTIAGIEKSTENKRKAGKIKKTGKNLSWEGDEQTRVGYDYVPSESSRREAYRQFSRVGTIAETYFGDDAGIYGDAWPSWGSQVVAKWGKWVNDKTGPEFKGMTVARDPYYATQAQWDNLRDYYAQRRIDDRSYDQELRNYYKEANKKRMTKKK